MKERFNLIVVFLVFFSFNLLFNFHFFQLLFSTNPTDHIAQGESALAEFTVENSYQNLLKLKNPYFLSNSFFYPYSVNLSMNDPGVSHALFFFILRPFLDIHPSMIIILLMNNLLSSFVMFFLLRKFGVRISLSLLFSLCFSFTPYISYRLLGHYIYTPLYIFPLFFLLLDTYLHVKNLKTKIFISSITGAFSAFILMLNLYYFVTILLGILFYFIYYFISERHTLYQFIRHEYKYLLLSLFTSLFFLIPWIYATWKLVQFEGLVKTPGFGGAITLSADLLSFVTPSEYNPFYNYLFSTLGNVSGMLGKYRNFYLSSWDRFAYTGIILLIGYILFIIFRRKLPLALKRRTNPHLFVSILFAILLLGPFLKIFNRWMLPLEDVGVVFPLPFLIFHYIPGLSAIRAPTRFLPAFVFLAAILVALFGEYFFKKYNRKYFIFISFLFVIFFFDQFYTIHINPLSPLPLIAYQYIKQDKDFFSVLEIPFTVRDGFDYIGFVHAINPLSGFLIHRKPIIGGYTARVSPAIFSYYKNLPAIGYIAQIIDKGNYNPDKEKPKEPLITSFQGNTQQAISELDFLDAKYIILKNDEKYSPIIVQLLPTFGFHKQLTDGIYDLYVRQPVQTNFEEISFGSPGDYLYTAQGFSIRENGFRWIEGKVAKVFLKTNDLFKTKLTLEASSFHKSQEADVYFNDYQVGQQTIGIERTRLLFDISGKIKPGINTVIIRFTNNFKPSAVIPKEKDSRNLAAQLFSMKIE